MYMQIINDAPVKYFARAGDKCGTSPEVYVNTVLKGFVTIEEQLAICDQVTKDNQRFQQELRQLQNQLVEQNQLLDLLKTSRDQSNRYSDSAQRLLQDIVAAFQNGQYDKQGMESLLQQVNIAIQQAKTA